jgi:AcrR family transcriptional regulator
MSNDPATMQRTELDHASPSILDPERDRKEQILAAAAELVSIKGYHAVSMTDIGSIAGISGPGIYRHFESKSAVLVALFDRVIDRLLAESQEIVLEGTDVEGLLVRLAESQVGFVVADRTLAQVYYSEIHNLPEEDRRRLRRKQRLYLEEWVHLLRELRVDLDDAEARTIVHAAIGAIQSTLFHSNGLSADRLRQLLMRAAESVLAIDGRTSLRR